MNLTRLKFELGWRKSPCYASVVTLVKITNIATQPALKFKTSVDSDLTDRVKFTAITWRVGSTGLK